MRYRMYVAPWSVALLAVVFVGACRNADRSARDTVGATGMARTDSAAQRPMPAPVSDAAIFAFLMESNRGEIAAGNVAASKATNPEVKTFAHQMVVAHTKMLTEGEALAKRLNILPKPMAGDSTGAMNKTLTARLTSSAKGTAFDTAYVNSQVSSHEMALAFIQLAADQTTTPEVRQMLSDVTPMRQHQLDLARSLQTVLSR